MNDNTTSKRNSSSYKGGMYFALLCALVGFAPMIVMFLFTPIAYYFGCSGNEGTGVVCKDAPSLSSIAGGIFGVGTWGIFLTLPSAGVIFLIGALTGLMSPSEDVPFESGPDRSWTLDAHGGPQDLYCPSCSVLVAPEDYQGTCQQCSASFGLGSVWRPQPRSQVREN